ncbi:MAG TPA: 23S rRNA (uracil(1939)-C(5))-methyltransferase RlmD [Candidatus Acidoferrales bacterium]|nr:23S rRNA (uracil(1939)-C(5))-methyltransferase RlmD [Candidatus Acidoferrales bacterium]
MRVKIEKLVYGGEGLAHGDGATLFVPFVLPGEEVEATVKERSKKFSRCRLENVLTRSAERIEPDCPHFGVCGGCHYQHIPHELQLRFKEQILRETLRRLGRLDWSAPITIHASPPFGYRNRAQWRVRPIESRSQRPSRSETSNHSLGIGYFQSSSTIFCPVESCGVLSPRIASVFEALKQMIADRALPEEIQEIEALADSDDHKVLLNITCSHLRSSQKTIAVEISKMTEGVESVLLQSAAGDKMELSGPGYLNYSAGDKRFRVGHLSFFQVNRHLVKELAQSVAAAAGGGNLAFDLYAGVGLLSAFLADNFVKIEAVEADPAAARDLEANVSRSRNISSHNLAAEVFLSRWKRKQGGQSPEAIVVDPPRAGLEPAALSELQDVSPPRIVYVSCDPSTLARDLAKLCARLYKVEEIHLFDMFPQTYHMETLVRLERAS